MFFCMSWMVPNSFFKWLFLHSFTKYRSSYSTEISLDFDKAIKCYYCIFNLLLYLKSVFCFLTRSRPYFGKQEFMVDSMNGRCPGPHADRCYKVPVPIHSVWFHKMRSCALWSNIYRFNSNLSEMMNENKSTLLNTTVSVVIYCSGLGIYFRPNSTSI